MLYFLETTGEVLKVVPERIYQGSVEGNKIMLVAPFASSTTVEVVFALANGQTTIPFQLSYIGQMQSEAKNSKTAMHAWQCLVPVAVTQQYGEVQVQFTFTSSKNGKIASAVTAFTVERGLTAALPDVPTEDVYQQMKESIESLQADLANAYYSARAIYAWNASCTYNANEVTFYPCGQFGAFVQSLQDANTNRPINAEGVVDNNWKILVSFDTIAESYFEALQEVAKQARKELEEVQTVIANLKEVNNSVLECVEQLPSQGEKNKIYAVLSSKSNQLFTLYIWIEKWICLGEKGIESLAELPEGAVLYLAQELTAEQKRQARTNIEAQAAGNYLLKEELDSAVDAKLDAKLEAELENVATIDAVQSVVDTKVQECVTELDSKLLQLQSHMDGQLQLQEQEIVAAVDGKLLEVQTTLQEKITELDVEIEKLQLSAGSGGGASLSGSVGTTSCPVYLENGELKACSNLKVENNSVFITSNSNCHVSNKSTNILIGDRLSVSNIGTKSLAIGSNILCTGDEVVSIGSGQVEGEYLVSVGVTNVVRGSYSVAFGPWSVAEGEMACALGPLAEVSEDYATVIGSEENKSVYYYGNLLAKSDMRDKADIEALDCQKSLQFINALKTITYVNNDRKKYRDKNKRHIGKGIGVYDKIAHANATKKGTRRQIGVIAQDVEETMQKIYNTELANIVNDSLYTQRQKGECVGLESQKFVNYVGFIPLLISAMQEQQRQIEALKNSIENSKKESV